MKQELYFSLEKEYDVEFQLGELNLNGKLIFQKNTPAHIKIISTNYSLIMNNDCPNELFCKTDNDTFRLIDCKKFGSEIFPQLIIFNCPNEVNSFNNLEININELNVILHDGFFNSKVRNKKFISDVNKSNFTSSITENIKIKEISDYWCYWTEIIHNADVETKFTQRHIISIKTKQLLSLNEIKPQSNHICLLFSLLTLKKLHINYVWIENEGTRYSVYYHTDRTMADTKTEWSDSLIHLKMVNNAQWSDIFNSSYKTTSFEKLWTRFYGMLSYKSYWEFDILGYMSILDYYLQDKFKNKKITFKKRIDLLYNEMPDYIKKYLSLSDEHFKKLIDVRNGVAHCIPEKLNVYNDFSELQISKNRLIILLNYLVLKELNISDICYSRFTERSINSIMLGAKLNKKWLNKITDDIPKITLGKEDYALLCKNNASIIYPLFIASSGKQYKFRLDLSIKARGDHLKRLADYQNVCDYIDAQIINNLPGNPSSQYINTLHVHLDEEDDFLELHGAITLNN